MIRLDQYTTSAAYIYAEAQTTLNALALILIYQPNVKKKYFAFAALERALFCASMNKKI